MKTPHRYFVLPAVALVSLCAVGAAAQIAAAPAPSEVAGSTASSRPNTAPFGDMNLEIRNETDRYQEKGKEKTFEIWAKEPNVFRKLATLKPGERYKDTYASNGKDLTIKVGNETKMVVSAWNYLSTPGVGVYWGTWAAWGSDNKWEQALEVGKSLDYSYGDRSWWAYRDVDVASASQSNASTKQYVVSLWRIPEHWDS